MIKRFIPHIIVLCAFLFLLSLLQVSYGSWKKNDEIMRALQAKIMLTDTLVGNLDSLRKKSRQWTLNVDESQHLLRPETDLGTFQKVISGLLSQNGLLLVSMIPDGSNRNSEYSISSFQLTVKGDYKRLLSFLDKLENSRYIVRITRLNMVKERQAGMVKLTTHFSVFWSDRK